MVEGIESVTSPPPRLAKPLRVIPVSSLPEQVAVGKGTALFVDGRCSHPDMPVARLRVAVDDRTYPVTASGMPLPDAIDRDDYWWAIVPFPAVSHRRVVRISVHDLLSDGTAAAGELGAIELLPEPEAAGNGRPTDTRVPAARSSRPLVAICMATFEPPLDLFERQIDSIRAQSHENWVCVISDDDSGPERLQRMREVLGDDPRFLLSPAPRRLGFYHNFERALGLAPREAAQIALCDQDDMWYPDKLEVLSSRLEPGTTLAYSDMRLVDRGGARISDTYWTHRRNNHTNFGSLLVANTITGAASLFDRRVLDYALPLPPRHGDAYHDHWIALVAMALGDVSYVDRPLYEYVQHGGAAIGHARANAGRRRRREAAGTTRWLLDRLRWRHLQPALRRIYFDHYTRTALTAQVLEMRCEDAMAPAKRRVLRRFEDSTRGIAWLAARSVRPWLGATETLGREQVLLGALAWRRLARSASRLGRLPSQAFGAPATRRQDRRSSQGRARGGWLTPILVDYFARDGSTLMMRLLSSSPGIAVEEAYPFERKYFAYLWRWARLIDRGDWPEDDWGARAFGSISQEHLTPVMGPPPWHPRTLIESRMDATMSEHCFELVWGEFSRRAAASTRASHGGSEGGVAYYAEKHLNTWHLDLAELPPVRIIALLRDPRDTYVSIKAFNRLRGPMAFGREHAASDREHLHQVIRRQGERLRWIAGLLVDGEVPVIRYEDLVLDLPGVARRLGDWLGVELDPDAALGDREVRRLHVSSDSPADSIGRWKRELDPEAADIFARELRSELRAVGFEP